MSPSLGVTETSAKLDADIEMERDSQSMDRVLYSLKWSLNTSDIEAAINQFSYLVLHQFTKRWSLIWSITQEEGNKTVAGRADDDQDILCARNDLKAVSNYHERLKLFFLSFIEGDERCCRLDGIQPFSLLKFDTLNMYHVKVCYFNFLNPSLILKDKKRNNCLYNNI